jgi:hypothetical protein
MKRQLNLEQLRQLLNRSNAQLDEKTLKILHQARTQALKHHDEQQVHTLALSGHGKYGHWHTPAHHKPYLWAVGLLLAASILSGIAYWHKTPSNDTSDVDIAILTDDLPLQVYVD